MYSRILVATDGSELSRKAVDAAISLAEVTKAEVVAIKVIPAYPQSYFEGAIVLAPQEISRIEEQWATEAASVVQAVQAAANTKKVTVQPITVKSDQIGETLIRQAVKLHCDLIVMASHGRRGLNRFFLGSETQYVLAHSTLPVMVLR